MQQAGAFKCIPHDSREVNIFAASGRGTLASYVINERPHPAFGEPHSIAIVQLEEGPKMASNVVGCPQTPEALQLDMSLQVTFEAVSEDITLPLFTPVEVSS